MLYTIFSILFGIALVILESKLSFETVNNFSYLYLILSGFVMSIGIIVPGVSSTIILMLLGIYPIYLSSVSSIYLPILIPIGIGIILGGFFFMKLTRFLLNKFYVQTFYTIVGFTIGSIFVLIPEFNSYIDYFICALCIILGFITFLLYIQPGLLKCCRIWKFPCPSLLYAYQCGKRRLEVKEAGMTEHLAKPLKPVFSPRHKRGGSTTPVGTL